MISFPASVWVFESFSQQRKFSLRPRGQWKVSARVLILLCILCISNWPDKTWTKWQNLWSMPLSCFCCLNSSWCYFLYWKSMCLGFWAGLDVSTKKYDHVKVNPTIKALHHHLTTKLYNFPVMDVSDGLDPAASSHYVNMGVSTERRNNAARCESELHFYCSIAPERSVNYLWKCWQKRSRFNKAYSSREEQQPTVRWGLNLVLRPLDFNDGPVVSLCDPTV